MRSSHYQLIGFVLGTLQHVNDLDVIDYIPSSHWPSQQTPIWWLLVGRRSRSTICMVSYPSYFKLPRFLRILERRKKTTREPQKELVESQSDNNVDLLEVELLHATITADDQFNQYNEAPSMASSVHHENEAPPPV